MAKSLAAIILFSIATVQFFAQEESHGNVSLVNLFPPFYPPLAKQVRIAGDVQLTPVIRSDGSIDSAIVVSGHPLLKQAALDSAQHSQFACEECDNEVRSVQMVFLSARTTGLLRGGVRPSERR